MTDWSDTYGAGRRIGLNHALFKACEDYEAVLPLERVEENKLYGVTVARVSACVMGAC